MENQFDPEEHDVEMDEIARMYAERDMEDDKKLWAREQANRFYADFATLDIDSSINVVHDLIIEKELTLPGVNEMLDNMILVFEEDEEYEKCHICTQIKSGLNVKIQGD